MPKQITYRYQEILTVLRNNLKGLTTAQIFKLCKNKAGSELPDTAITGQCVFAMRRSNYLTTSDAVGGNIHKITSKGLYILAAELGEDCDIAAKADEKTEAPVVRNAPEAAPRLDSETSGTNSCLVNPVIYQFDEAVNIIRQALIQSLNSNEVKIRDKLLKLSALERLEQIVSDDIAALLAAIRTDLEQLETGGTCPMMSPDATRDGR